MGNRLPMFFGLTQAPGLPRGRSGWSVNSTNQNIQDLRDTATTYNLLLHDQRFDPDRMLLFTGLSPPEFLKKDV